MIEFGHGNLLKSDTEALVNTVNTVGVMGKGVALQFKQAFPENYKSYRRACDQNEVRLGAMHVWDSGMLGDRRYVINFPTKGHWESKSRLADIADGLQDLVNVVTKLSIDSIALPALGCGNGGLSWSEVLPLIESALGPLEARVVVYPPSEAPEAKEMVIGTPRPSMSYGRAALIVLVGRYARAAMRERFDLARPGASLLEIQKVMYLLQAAGQPLKLHYEKGRYGPYAENLNKVLEAMEGHYIRGYGDRSRAILALDPIEVLSGAEEQAREWLVESHTSVQRDIDRVLNLIEGWESPYGLELLATVLFAAQSDDAVLNCSDRAIDYVHSWNRRKQSTFPESHVKRAWDHLASRDWLRIDAAETTS